MKEKTPLQRELATKELDEKYPKIIFKEGENLNIQDNIHRIFKKCWYDVDTYPTIVDIAVVTNTTEDIVIKFAKKHKFEKRRYIKSIL